MQFKFDAKYHDGESYHPVYFSKIDISDKFVTKIELISPDLCCTVSLKRVNRASGQYYVKFGQEIEYWGDNCLADIKTAGIYDMIIVTIAGVGYSIPTILDTSCPNMKEYINLRISNLKGSMKYNQKNIDDGIYIETNKKWIDEKTSRIEELQKKLAEL